MQRCTPPPPAHHKWWVVDMPPPLPNRNPNQHQCSSTMRRQIIRVMGHTLAQLQRSEPIALASFPAVSVQIQPSAPGLCVLGRRAAVLSRIRAHMLVSSRGRSPCLRVTE